MTLRLPDWFEGGFPDGELLVLDALQPVLDEVDVLDRNGDPVLDAGQPRRPTGWTHLPDNFADRLPIVRVYRGGGASDMGVLKDPAAVQLAVIADTRAESWQLMELCQQWLLTYYRGGAVVREGGATTQIQGVEELIGPQYVPELNPDKRMVVRTFRVTCRLPRGLPNYERIREQKVRALLP
ncbi:hypothetical protein [Nocardia sp. NPDC057227]|uniref:phage tail termination protein n=1 Tax=Nocardia sp. NPDC057227 TaxID=3346056 RepID=UPI00363F3464